jgi:hypothetical protein
MKMTLQRRVLGGERGFSTNNDDDDDDDDDEQKKLSEWKRRD